MNPLDLGVTPNLTARKTRRIQVMNLASWVGAVTPLVWCVPGLIYGQWVLVVYNVGASLLFGLDLIFRPTRHRATLLLTVGTAFLAGHHWFVLGPEIANYAWFVPLVALPFLMFDERSKRTAAAWAVVEMTLFSLGEFEVSFMEPLASFPAGSRVVSSVINSVVALASLVWVIALFVRQAAQAEAALEVELDRSERLLLNVLPVSIAERLKAGESTLADHHDAATVLFADIVGFTPLAKSMPPADVVAILSALFSSFDALAAEAGLEKIKTIGDAYMVAAGVPTERADHAEATAELALRMQQAARQAAEERGVDLSLRIGIHSGEVVAGVIGQAKFAYDLWGDTVNTASRMESHGAPGRIQLTAETRTLLPERFVCERRGMVDVKGRGEVETFWLLA